MKTRWIGMIGLTMILAALLVGTLGRYVLPNAFRTTADHAAFGPGMMGDGMMGGRPLMNGSMMGGRTMMNGGGMMGQFGTNAPAGVTPLSSADARAAVATYLAGLGNNDLALDEVLIFENNAYARVIETSTGIGAFEVLVDPVTKAVVPEPGPNMMWNRKYSPMSVDGFGNMGMMGGVGYQGHGEMMGNTSATSATMPVKADAAIKTAQRYLDTSLPGAQAATTADAFYGYYTIEIARNGQPIGMLSVNGYTRAVFLHTWHGTFVRVAEPT